MTQRLLLLAAFSLFLGSTASAQKRPGRAFSEFIHSGEMFGHRLLLETHQTEPDRNIVISPLPILMGLDALLSKGTDNADPERETLIRMLRARIPDRPPVIAPNSADQKDSTLQTSPIRVAREYHPIWLSTTFRYRGKESIKQNFVEEVTRIYGIEFQQAQGDNKAPTLRDGRRADFWIASSTYLETPWNTNAFAYSKPVKSPFSLRNRESIDVETLKSETEFYYHAKTDEFEAVELTGTEAYVLLAVPAPGRDIFELERKLSEEKISIESLLKKELGYVVMPPFHLRFENDLRPPLEKMGIRRLFSDVNSLSPMVTLPEGARLDDLIQQVAMDVDAWGIRADAETLMGGVYGGILATRIEPFHMNIDRPFLFFVRDNTSDALLFAGVVMNPAEP